MGNDDFERNILIVLQRIAGALECLCDHFGAGKAPKSSKRGGR